MIVARGETSKRMSTQLAVVGDIGGTNARFGLADLSGELPRIFGVESYLCRDFDGPVEALEAFLRDKNLSRQPEQIAVAVAGPVHEGAVSFTNAGWRLSEDDLLRRGFNAVHLLNDYEGLAFAVPFLGPQDLRRIGRTPDPASRGTLAVIGPGTGLGVSAVTRDARGDVIAATEGGHISFAPADDVETELLTRLSSQYGRVSIERILSGPGLVNLHALLSDIEGTRIVCDEAAMITQGCVAGDPACARTVERFCAILGAVAGDLALAFGAVGGVFIGGGIAPAIVSVLETGSFRARFEAKGRLQDYMQSIPTKVILRSDAALLGAACALRRCA
jgi:glucokinase